MKKKVITSVRGIDGDDAHEILKELWNPKNYARVTNGDCYFSGVIFFV